MLPLIIKEDYFIYKLQQITLFVRVSVPGDLESIVAVRRDNTIERLVTRLLKGTVYWKLKKGFVPTQIDFLNVFFTRSFMVFHLF